MKIYGPGEIRNVALVGHGHTGKTSLAAALLHLMGATPELGRVDKGTAVTDWDEEEIERKLSIMTGLAHGDWQGQKVNLLDTPGSGAFIQEAHSALEVVEGALVLLDGAAGLEVMTEKVWEFADEYHVPRMIVVNKMDRDNANFETVLDDLHARYGKRCVPLLIPMGEGAAFRGVIDVVRMRALVYSAPGKFEETTISLQYEAAAKAARVQIMEGVAETDDDLLAKYLDSSELSEEEFQRGLRAGIKAGTLDPVLCCSALKNIGCSQVLSAITAFLPSPAAYDGSYHATNLATLEEQIIHPDPNGPLCALVFKTLNDPYTGRLSLVKVYSGTIRHDSTLHNESRRMDEKGGSTALLQGKQQIKVDAIQAGDIGAILKLKETLTGDTLCDKSLPLRVAPVQVPQPVIAFAISPKSQQDDDKLSVALHKLAEEDTCLSIERDMQTHELLLHGTGQLHIEATLGRLKKKFGVAVDLHKPKIPYRETLKVPVDIHARHKKQTGGHGQFADVKIRFAPLARGEGFKFIDEVYGGTVPKNYIPAVEKGLNEALGRGVLAGYQTVDFSATLYDGQHHAVDSSDLAFKLAAGKAFREAARKARPTLLEPVMVVEVTVPDECMGDTLGDLNSRRGRVQNVDNRGGRQAITAQVPMAELLDYSPALRSITSDRGSFTLAFSHYDEAPAIVQKKIIEQNGSKAAEQDAEE
jgi:elongation factor G